MTDDVLPRLISMSRALGDPSKDLVILGEGNCSARADAETFWVKASGSSMHGIDRSGFVRMRFEPVVALLDGHPLERCALFAREIVELKLTTVGPLPSTIDRAEIYQRLPESI